MAAQQTPNDDLNGGALAQHSEALIALSGQKWLWMANRETGLREPAAVRFAFVES